MIFKSKFCVKDKTNPEIYKQLYLQLISEYPLSEIFFTDGSKTEDGVAVAAVSTKRINKPFTRRLPCWLPIVSSLLYVVCISMSFTLCSKSLQSSPCNKLIPCIQKKNCVSVWLLVRFSEVGVPFHYAHMPLKTDTRQKIRRDTSCTHVLT